MATNRKLGRTTDIRTSMLRTLTTDLILHGKVETTEKRKKDLPSKLNARRSMMRKINKVKDNDGKNVDLPGKLFTELAPKYEGRVGGYTRIVKAGPRKGDGAEKAILMLV